MSRLDRNSDEKEVIQFFNVMCKVAMEDDLDITEYRKTLESEKTRVSNLKLSGKLGDILRHPIRYVTTLTHAKKINSVSRKFDVLVNSSLENFIDNTGDIIFDLTNALMFNKPDAIERFMGKHDIKKLVKKVDTI